jgi:predicted dehydrogenase
LQVGDRGTASGVVCSRTAAAAAALAAGTACASWTTDLAAAVTTPGSRSWWWPLPNAQHEPAVALAASAGKAVLCTKPLGGTAAEARRMCELVERSGVFAGYLEDLCFLPRTAAAVAAARAGPLGVVLSARYRLAHSGPHSAWFRDPVRRRRRRAARPGLARRGGAPPPRRQGRRPVAALCETRRVRSEQVRTSPSGWSASRAARSASWTSPGRRPAGWTSTRRLHGTLGSVRLDHPALAAAADPPEAEPGAQGVPVMLAEVLAAERAGRPSPETFRDGLVVNEVLDACYRSARSGAWEAVAPDR